MKKFLKTLVFVLTILTVAYTMVAFFLIRGLGIYRLGTTVGRILASSWQYTGLAAFLLVICTAVILLKGRKRGEAKIPAAAPQSEDAARPTEPLEPQKKANEERKKAKQATSGAKIPPAAAKPTDKVPPAAPAAAETELLPENVPEATEPMPISETESIPTAQPEATMLLGTSAADATVPLDESVAEATVLLSVDEIDEPEQTVLLPETTVVLQVEEVPQQTFCPQCGAAAKPGAKFCVKCGTRLGGL